MSFSGKNPVVWVVLLMSVLGCTKVFARTYQTLSATRELREATFENQEKFEGADVSQLMLATARSLETDEVGRGKGFTLTKSVGWAKLDASGDVEIQGSKRSHCTSATHAAFLKTIGQLEKQGKIKIDKQAREAFNSGLFRDVWNSNGYGPAKVMELLGGQNFKDASQARAGDVVKIDRANGSGHMVILSSIKDGEICYWSSNRKTKGLGERCEKTKGKEFVFSRLTDTQELQTGLNSLASNLRVDDAFEQVRGPKKSNGMVKLASLELVRPANVEAPIHLASYEPKSVRTAELENNKGRE